MPKKVEGASITEPQKRRGRPPTGETPQISLRLPPDARAALKRAQEELGTHTRSEALRVIVTDWLAEHKYLKPPLRRKRPIRRRSTEKTSQ